MTILKTNIKKAVKVERKDEKKGAYLATFTNEDDRIVFLNDEYSWSKVPVIEINSFSGKFYIQQSQDQSNYTNLKKIKKITIEVELE